MIARDSKSYPYLAIAQHNNVPYAEVLKYSEGCYTKDFRPLYLDWKLEVWLLERDKSETVSYSASK